MVEIRQYRKDMGFDGYDKVYEKADDFFSVIPYLVPKLEGAWKYLILEPKLDAVRTLLDTNIVPSYVTVVLAVESNQLQQLYMERPQLVKKEKTAWDHYMDLIAVFPVPLDDKAMREIYYRCGPKEENLAAALEELKDYSYISMREVNKHFAPKERVFASQVVRAFLTYNNRYKWKMLNQMETEIGTRVAFYAMRKSVRAIFREKRKYLNNESIKDRHISGYSTYDITLLYALFETATNPSQLYPILYMFERRQLPNVSSQ